MNEHSLALAPGTRVDSLRVDRVLGQGAFGITYLVTDTVLDKSFAMKEYLPRGRVERDANQRLVPLDEASQNAFADGLAHFLLEGRTLARLDHPNVVKVFRCFEANGTAYLLMPWYRGEALHTLLKRSGTLSRDEAMALAKPLLGALAYIHDHDVVHGDIKPANIYITKDGEPVLLDFGAAENPDTASAGPKNQGSKGYAAPEQSNTASKTGAWTDIYGLSATLYRCISGRLPVAADQRELARGNQENDPLPPLDTLVDPADFAPLIKAVDAGLRLDPRERPRNAAQWRAYLEPAATTPTFTPLGTAEQEGREWLPLVLLGIFIAVLLASVIYLFTDQGHPEPGEGADAVRSSVQDDSAKRHGSPEEEARWRAALDADTAFGYQQFRTDFPESIHDDQARVHIERLDHQAWGMAKAEGTRAAVEAYLEQFTAPLHQADADILLNELELAEQAELRKQEESERADDAAWEQARRTRTLASMDAYLSNWPAGLHADEARALRRSIQGSINDRRAFEAARKLNTIEAYQTYMAAFPGGASVAAALEAIDDLTLRPGKTFRDCPDCPSMVVVPPGSFWQGSDESNPMALKKETPRRMVTFAEPFAVSVFEITMAQWDLCVSAGACKTRPRDNGWGRGSRPVIMVSWNDAQEFVGWLNQRTGQSYSLPSESQWEYVARAGEESDWLGGDPVALCRYANIAGGESGFRWQHADCSDGAAMETLPVGSLQANAFGLHDVIGNVAEWTLDCMNLSYLDAPADGSAWGRGICSSRMTRGGSWFTGTRDVRLPARFNLKNGDRNDFTGFRVVRKVDLD